MYNSNTKLIIDEEPEHVTMAYKYISQSAEFYFVIAYISSTNILKYQFYEFYSSSNSVNLLNNNYLSSVTRTYDSYSYTFQIQNKGISCDNLKDSYYSSYSYITCFVIANTENDDYLIPLTFSIVDYELYFENNVYDMDVIKVNNNTQIKSDTNYYMNIAYVCYTTSDNIGKCVKFILNYYSGGIFDTGSDKSFEKNCRADAYGMKVSYIFETGKVLFSCSNLFS